jgi:hypothetical protein
VLEAAGVPLGERLVAMAEFMDAHGWAVPSPVAVLIKSEKAA